LQAVGKERTLSHMRAVAIAAVLFAASPSQGGRSASLRVHAEVVSSARVLASASAAGVGFESRSFGGRGAALLLQQRSGPPMRLADGTPLPREGQRPLVVPAAAGPQLVLAPADGGAVVVVTLFPDGAPPEPSR